MGVTGSAVSLLAQGVAVVYGLLTLALAVLYSLKRKDTWSKETEGELNEFRKACKSLWSLSENDDNLSHNFLTLQNGLQMHYLSTTATPQSTESLVIFLHGFPDTCYLWEQQLRSGVAQKAQLVSLDLPGCGGSDSHSSYGPDQILNAIAEAIVQLKSRYPDTSTVPTSPRRVVLVSHDWGGVVAYRLAGETSGLVDEVVVLNSAYPAAARDGVATRLSRSRDVLLAGDLKQARLPMRAVFRQLFMSNYIFMLNLRPPLAKWMPWLSACLVKSCHELALRNSPHATKTTYTKSLASSYGPGPVESTSLTPSGASYGPTVQPRSQKSPQGDWDERVRIYSEGLALGKWTPSYPDYREPLWLSSPGSARKGQFSYPVHVVFGMQDIALDPEIVLEGLEGFMLDAEDGMRKPQVSGEGGVGHQSVGRSSVIKLPGCGHWAMLENEGMRALEELIGRLVERS